MPSECKQPPPFAVKKAAFRLTPESGRVLIQPFELRDEQTCRRVIEDVLNRPHEDVVRSVQCLLEEFDDRHVDLAGVFSKRFLQVQHLVPPGTRPTTRNSRESPQSRSICGVSDRCTSLTGAKAETIRETGARMRLSSHTVFIDRESLPTGMAIPSSGQTSMPTVFTVSNSAPSWPGSPEAAIQFADRRMSEIESIAAEAMLVTASAIAMRPDAGALTTASGVRSPMAMASPVSLRKPLRVTAASATGTWCGPTIWSRATSPPTERSPIVTRKVLAPTAGKRRTRRRASTVSSEAASKRPPSKDRRQTSRDMRGGLPQQDLQRHVHGIVTQQAVAQLQLFLRRRLPQYCERTAFAAAHGFEFFQAVRADGQHVAFLRLVAPDFHRRHGRVRTGYLTQLEAAAPAAVVQQFRQGVGQAAGAAVVDGQDRVVLAERPAGVYHFLAAALHFRVAALHRGVVQVFLALPAAHRRGRAAAESRSAWRPAKHDDVGALLQGQLLDELFADGPHAAGDHDGLVVAPYLTTQFLLEGAEITAQVGAAEFVVERGRADRALDHDVQCAWRCGPACRNRTARAGPCPAGRGATR